VPEASEPAEDTATDLAVTASVRPRLPARRPSEAAPPQTEAPGLFGGLRLPPSETIESPLAAYRRSGVDLAATGGGGTSSSGTGFQSARSGGNSDRTNYAGRVLVHLNRAPSVPVSGRGFARVLFIIEPDGSLAYVDVTDSSGSPSIDRAAKQQVRNAAPFPKPPNGKRRQLSFVYQTPLG